MDQEARDRSQIVGVVFLGVGIDQRLEELKVVKDLWEDIDQQPSLDHLLTKAEDDRGVLLRLVSSG